MTLPNFDPPHKEMGRHIASGVFNSGVVQTIKVLSQIASVVILSRLLKPDDFGLVAMASPVAGFVALFQDFGLSQATVQKPNLTHDEVNAFFWINIAIGFALMLFIIAISPLVGWYYHEPRLVAFLAASGVFMLTGSLGNQHSAILTRRMQFGALAWTGTLGAAFGVSASIVAALLLRDHNGYWALYYGGLAGTIVPVIGVWMASRWRPTMPRRVAGLGQMLKFGAGVTVSGVAGFISGNLDNVLIGHRWGDQPLGLYDRAYKLLLFPLIRFVGPVSNTLVPVLSRLAHDPHWYRSIYLKTIGQLTLAVWPGTIWSIILADTLVPFVLGDKWTGVVPIFVPLAIACLGQTLGWSSGCLFISQGRTIELARWSIFGAVTCTTAFLIGLPYGPAGVAIGFAVQSYIFAPFFWWSLTRRGPIKLEDIIRAILPQAISGIISAAALFAYRYFVHAPPFAMLSGGLILSYATTAATMSLSPQGRGTLKQTLKAARRIVGHAFQKRV